MMRILYGDQLPPEPTIRLAIHPVIEVSDVVINGVRFDVLGMRSDPSGISFDIQPFVNPEAG